jgi:hypothetical protein
MAALMGALMTALMTALMVALMGVLMGGWMRGLSFDRDLMGVWTHGGGVGGFRCSDCRVLAAGTLTMVAALIGA